MPPFIKRKKEDETPTRTVTSVLMESGHERDLPDLVQTGKYLRADQVLYNNQICRFKIVLYWNVEQ